MVALAQKYKVNPVQIKAWKKEFLDNKGTLFGSAFGSQTQKHLHPGSLCLIHL
jgi:uncharacterized protein YjcR